MKQMIAAGALFLGACATSGVQPAASTTAQIVPADAAVTPEARQAVVSGNTEFSLDLYRWLLEDMRENPDSYTTPNVFYSPASISTALGMVYAGARGETAEQIADTLHFTVSPEQFHPAAGALLTEVQLSQDGREVAVANSLWAQEGMQLEQPFSNIMSRYYEAGINRVDYTTAEGRVDATQTINSWVEERTNNRIQNLIRPPMPQRDTRLILVNAVYLNADWSSPFRENRTERLPFTALSGEEIEVDMMRRIGRFQHISGEGWQAALLPYQGEELSMMVFLPDDVDGLRRLERQLTDQRLNEWVSELSESELSHIDLRIPKFRQTNRFLLGGALADLGMPLAFDKNRADLFGISTDMPPDYRLALSSVVHQSFVEVDEEGAEAAAATAVGVIMVTSGPRIDAVFNADHPFIYLIRDNRSGMILFIGRMAEPDPAANEPEESEG